MYDRGSLLHNSMNLLFLFLLLFVLILLFLGLVCAVLDTSGPLPSQVRKYRPKEDLEQLHFTNNIR
jgi:hypothetical protein